MTTCGSQDKQINNWMAVVDGQTKEISCFLLFFLRHAKANCANECGVSLFVRHMWRKITLLLCSPNPKRRLVVIEACDASLLFSSTSLHIYTTLQPNIVDLSCAETNRAPMTRTLPLLSMYFLYCMHEEKKI